MTWLILFFTFFQCNCDKDKLEQCLNIEYSKCENIAYLDWNVCMREQYHCKLLDCDLEFKCTETWNEDIANCRIEYMNTFNNCKWFYFYKENMEDKK